jgi:serine/threonine protein kinase
VNYVNFYLLTIYLTASNLLLTISDDVKVSDFGLTHELAVDEFNHANDATNCDLKWSLLCAAPEVLANYSNPDAYQQPADIWYARSMYLYTMKIGARPKNMLILLVF